MSGRERDPFGWGLGRAPGWEGVGGGCGRGSADSGGAFTLEYQDSCGNPTSPSRSLRFGAPSGCGSPWELLLMAVSVNEGGLGGRALQEEAMESLLLVPPRFQVSPRDLRCQFGSLGSQAPRVSRPGRCVSKATRVVTPGVSLTLAVAAVASCLHGSSWSFQDLLPDRVSLGPGSWRRAGGLGSHPETLYVGLTSRLLRSPRVSHAR